jgi:hypothetical protein
LQDVSKLTEEVVSNLKADVSAQLSTNSHDISALSTAIDSSLHATLSDVRRRLLNAQRVPHFTVGPAGDCGASQLWGPAFSGAVHFP